MNTTRAARARAWWTIASRRVSPRTCTGPASTLSRSARSLICSGDSSPETYSVRIPAPSRRAAHCSKSVDFPMPGSPPTKTTDPGTIPPPRTKSNSRRPVCHRSNPAAPMADSRIGGWADSSIRLSADPPIRRITPTGSSTSEFHAPHASQRPPHFGCSAPHSLQRNTEWLLDTAGLRRGFARRVVVEPRVLLLEEELHAPRRTVPLLAHDQLGDPLDAVVRLRIDRTVVKFLAVDETHDVRVLLDRARFSQVRELGAPVLATALLGRARELGERDDGHIELLGQGLERPRDERNLLLPALRIRRTLHHLQVIDHHHPHVVLRLEPSRLRAHRERREHGGIVDPDRRRAEQARGPRQLGVVVIAQLAAPQALRVHQPLGAQQPLHQLLLRHFE